MADMSKVEADSCKVKSQVAMQALIAYWQQPNANGYNFDDTLHVLLTLTDSGRGLIQEEEKIT